MIRTFLLAFSVAAGLTGCAGKGGAVKETIFYPPPPNEPRLQFLMGISDSFDIQGKPSNFSIVVTGNEKDEKAKPIRKPYGVTTDKGKMYVCDTGSAAIIVIDPAKKTFEYLKGNFGPGKLLKPINSTVDEGGNLYVADVERKEIVIFDAEGNFVKAIGKPHNLRIVDVAVSKGLIYGLDIMNHEVKVFDWSGNLKGAFGKAVENPDGLALPTNMAMDAEGFLYATNGATGKVVKMDRDGHIVSSFGKLGDGFGQFGRPKGITVGKDGTIYVVDAAHQNVQAFNQAGRLLTFFGESGPGRNAGALNLPAGVAVMTENLDFYQSLADPSFVVEQVVVVTNQFGKNKISVYGLGNKKGKAPVSPAAAAAKQEAK